MHQLVEAPLDAAGVASRHTRERACGVTGLADDGDPPREVARPGLERASQRAARGAARSSGIGQRGVAAAPATRRVARAAGCGPAARRRARRSRGRCRPRSPGAAARGQLGGVVGAQAARAPPSGASAAPRAPSSAPARACPPAAARAGRRGRARRAGRRAGPRSGGGARRRWRRWCARRRAGRASRRAIPGPGSSAGTTAAPSSASRAGRLAARRDAPAPGSPATTTTPGRVPRARAPPPARRPGRSGAGRRRRYAASNTRAIVGATAPGGRNPARAGVAGSGGARRLRPPDHRRRRLVGRPVERRRGPARCCSCTATRRPAPAGTASPRRWRGASPSSPPTCAATATAPSRRAGEDHAAYSKRAMARDLVGAMAALGHARFAVAGHDRGGRVAHRMALDHPDVVERAAVLDIVPTRTLFATTDQALRDGLLPLVLPDPARRRCPRR